MLVIFMLMQGVTPCLMSPSDFSLKRIENVRAYCVLCLPPPPSFIRDDISESELVTEQDWWGLARCPHLTYCSHQSQLLLLTFPSVSALRNTRR